jgi:hypothetical protein
MEDVEQTIYLLLQPDQGPHLGTLSLRVSVLHTKTALLAVPANKVTKSHRILLYELRR